MNKLPAKVHFVCPPHKMWPELHGSRNIVLSPDVIAERSVSGLACWILRTYYELRDLGDDVSIGPATRPDAINITEPNSFGRKKRLSLDFVASAVHDQIPTGLANCHIVQNAVPGDGLRPRASVPHWPQPGIIPRDKARGLRVAKLSFKGYWINLDEGLRDQAFRDQLSRLGIELDLGPVEAMPSGANWADYASSDAVIAVRNMTVYDAGNKPASKLVNAWWGEVVSLLGPEPAFRELRQSPLDYFEIRQPADAIAALRQLQEQPQLYAAMIAHGVQRRAAFTPEAVRAAWIAAMEGPLFEGFTRWKSLSVLDRLKAVVKMHADEAKVRQQHVDRILYGPRLLDDGMESALAEPVVQAGGGSVLETRT